MKRIIKLFALLLVIALSAISLSSCQFLDNARAHQAFYTDDTKREISFDEHTYKILNPGKLSFVFTDRINTDGSYYVTTKDVPVLVARFEGDYFDLNREKSIISMWGQNTNIWYIRDDKYDKAEKLVENVKLDSYFFSYYDYGDPAFSDYYHQLKTINNENQKNELLNAELTEIVNKTLAADNDSKIDYKKLDSSDDAQKYFRLKRCDKDIIITNNEEIYLIRDYDDKYYVWNGDTLNENTICPIAEEDTPAVKQFFTDRSNACEVGNISWFFETYNYDYSEEQQGHAQAEGV